MAKPIEATPTLTGKDAERFLKNMLKTENRKPNKQEKEFAKSIGKIVKLSKTEAQVELMRKRHKLGLNPICTKCGRVMRTKSKHKIEGEFSHAEYYCNCSPNLILSVG